MTKLLRLLLLVPVIALGQELPDEDWLCIAEHENSSHYSTQDGEYITIASESKNKFILNPSKGFRTFQADFFDTVYGGCFTSNEYREFYTCSRNTTGTGYNILTFHMDVESKQFSLTDSLVNVIRLYMGNCTKL